MCVESGEGAHARHYLGRLETPAVRDVCNAYRAAGKDSDQCVPATEARFSEVTGSGLGDAARLSGLEDVPCVGRMRAQCAPHEIDKVGVPRKEKRNDSDPQLAPCLFTTANAPSPPPPDSVPPLTRRRG